MLHPLENLKELLTMTLTNSQSLCIECGLCCSGFVFDDVELCDEKEAESVECLGLEVDEEDGAFFLVQPCRALNGNKCGIYEYRPECCRSFECLLLKDYQESKVTKDDALRLIKSIRNKLKSSNKEAALHLIRTRLLGWID